MPHGRLTKKEINRYSKAELIKICREEGIKCNTKSSKTMLVAEVLKNKRLRGSLPVKEKRKMSDKQKENLARFRFKKSSITPEEDDSATVRKPVPVSSIESSTSSRVVVNPTASNRNEPAPPSLRENVTKELKRNKQVAERTPTLPAPRRVKKDVKIVGKIDIVEEEFRDTVEGKLSTTEYKYERRTRDRASLNANKLHHQHTFADQIERLGKNTSHTRRLMNRINENRKITRTLREEFSASTSKTSDLFDRNRLGKRADRNAEELDSAVKVATGKEDVDDEGEEGEFILEEEKKQAESDKIQTFSRLEQITLLNAKLQAGEITQEQFKEEVRKISVRQRESDQQKPQSREDRLRDQKSRDNVLRKIAQAKQTASDEEKRELQELEEVIRNSFDASRDKSNLQIFDIIRDEVEKSEASKVVRDLVDNILDNAVDNAQPEPEPLVEGVPADIGGGDVADNLANAIRDIIQQSLEEVRGEEREKKKPVSQVEESSVLAQPSGDAVILDEEEEKKEEVTDAQLDEEETPAGLPPIEEVRAGNNVASFEGMFDKLKLNTVKEIGQQHGIEGSKRVIIKELVRALSPEELRNVLNGVDNFDVLSNKADSFGLNLDELNGGKIRASGEKKKAQ